MHLSSNFNRDHLLLFIIICLSILTGWQIPLMEIDAVQYANISREMLHSGNYLQIYDNGNDYLDKPPLLFWLSAWSMHVFGVNDIAYRLPSFFCFLLAAFSIYQFCKLHYKQFEIAAFSVLIFAGSQAMFLINHDVRTDTMLVGWVMFSIWQLSAWYQNQQWKHFWLAAIGLSLGMMTKGPIALMVPVFSFLPHFVIKKEWNQLFKWQYLLLLAIIFVLQAPVLYGLYQQFDLHPEKELYGQKNVSGVKFYLWTQSFGRITGESTWKENSSFFFLFQNMIWSFLPWIIFFVLAFINEIRLLFKKATSGNTNEWISTGGFVLTYCALASSSAQLPHYIFVVFPFTAIITAKYIYGLTTMQLGIRLPKLLMNIHLALFSILAIATIILLLYYFPKSNAHMIGLVILLIVIVMFIINKRLQKITPLIRYPLLTIMSINILLNCFFYPSLLQYQPGIAINQWINQNRVPKEKISLYQFDAGRSIHFYANHTFPEAQYVDSLASDKYIITTKEIADSIITNNKKCKSVYTGFSYPVTRLSFDFLNPDSRQQSVSSFSILYQP